MFCRNCGSQMDPQAVVCVKCGVPKGVGTSFCPSCGSTTTPEAVICTTCGVALQSGATAQAQAQAQQPVFTAGAEQKSKLAAGLLGIFLGGFGVHNFYLGYMTKAIIQVCMGAGGFLLSFLTCGITAFATLAAGIWGLVEGIMILSGSIKVDGKGIPLKD